MFYFQNSQQLDPEESFAWKDSTLDRKLKELEERAKKQSESRSSEINGFDKNIDKSIGNWSNLPKAPNPDVILLKKARGEYRTHCAKKRKKVHFDRTMYCLSQRLKSMFSKKFRVEGP